MDVLGMKCREAAELMACRKASSYRERAVSGPTCAGHWAWMRATVTAATPPRSLELQYETSQTRRDMNYQIQGGNPLQDSAREWQKIQVGVLGFVGICGLLTGGKTTSRPSWVQDLSGFSALSGLVLALLAVALIASVAHPLTPRPISALTASRRLTGGIIVTFVAVGLTALAALSWWWPQGDRTAPSAPQLAVTTNAGSACGTLLQSGAGEIDLEIDGKTVRVPLGRLKSIEFADNCRG
jgi:hypothetical protein